MAAGDAGSEDSSMKGQADAPGLVAPSEQLGASEEEYVEEQDQELERRAAATIVHEFLKTVMKEPDEGDWRGADKLRDLYDCRVCVNHVAQIYSKGIMEGRRFLPDSPALIFDMRALVTVEEAEEILERVFDVRKRMPM